MDSIQSEAVWKTILRQIRQTSFSEDHKINIDRSHPRKHTYSFSGTLWMVSLGAFESCCETERFFSPVICLKIHPCIYLKVYSDCFEGLSYSILGFLIHSLELPIDFVNIEIFLISKKPLARSSRDLSSSIQNQSIPCHFTCWYYSVTVTGNGSLELDSISSSSNICTEVIRHN